ncbi:Multidrug resistance protein 1 [Yarrowia sp. C11]|nr:Multidrug resistance protein 1 [Yarrowia sp. C11]KAG5364016.1 Multidrug resistance protein 1 [Yarrowia sp. E02]
MDTAFSQLLNQVSGGRWFPYPEQREGFEVPAEFWNDPESASEEPEVGFEDGFGVIGVSVIHEKQDTTPLDGSAASSKNEICHEPQTESILDEDLMVGWYGPDDPDNPKNWSSSKKTSSAAQVLILTFSVYVGSSIYTPGLAEIMADFNCSETAALVPMTVFVFGYGLGPVFFSPLSEHPVIGRLWIYVITLAIFVILQVTTALSQNIGSLIALRFLGGIFSSPALAISGATFGDIYEIAYIPFALAFWAIAGICGPVFGPVIGSVFAQLLNWRWTFWVLTMISGVCLILLFFFFPETSAANILYRRARRLEKLTGKKYTTAARQEWAAKKMSTVAYDILLRPILITFTEPIVFALGLYIALLYSTLYSWFEAFPIVFAGIHGFNIIESGLAYLGLIVGGVIGVGAYLPIIYNKFTRPVLQGNFPPVSMFMNLCLIGSTIFPASLFFFAWTAHKSIHWIVPIIASGLCIIGMVFIFQTVFNYLSGSYPKYIASVFAGNGVFRAFVAGAFPLFTHQMFTAMGPDNFPVGWGTTLIAFIGILMGAIPLVLIKWGDKLKGSSRWA